MEKKSKKDTDFELLSTKLDCLNNRLNRMQNVYDSTLADLMVANRNNVESKRDIEYLKELQKLNSTDRDEKLQSDFFSFTLKGLLIFGCVSLSFVILGEVIKSIISCFM